MTPLGGFIVLLLIAGVGYAVVKDKHDGKTVFVVGNAILVLLLIGQALYYAFRWLSR